MASDFVIGKRARNQRERAREYLEQRLARHDFDELGELYAQLDTELSGAISRSTFYAWANRWRAERDADKSGAWTLASDDTGRPDIVMQVVAMVAGRSQGRVNTITAAEARWAVRLAVALPAMLEDILIADVPSGVGGSPDRTMIFWPAGKLLGRARAYIRAEQAGDVDRLLELQASDALHYTNEQRHLAEFVGQDVNVIVESLGDWAKKQED